MCWNEDEGKDDEFGYDAPNQGERTTFTMSYRKDEQIGRKHVLGSEFKSKKYRELDIVLGEVRLLEFNPHVDEVRNYDPNNYGI